MKNQQIAKRRREDKIARWVITVGGLTVIASVIAIMVLIVEVTLPLFMGSRTETIARLPKQLLQAKGSIVAVGLDEYLETGYAIDQSGTAQFLQLSGGSLLDRLPIRPGEEVSIEAITREAPNQYTILWQDGLCEIVRVAFHPSFAGQQRIIEHELQHLARFSLSSDRHPTAVTSRISENYGSTLVALTADHNFLVQRQQIETDLFGNETRNEFSFTVEPDIADQITAFTLNAGGDRLIAGTATGALLRWDLSANEGASQIDITQVVRDRTEITALGMIYGSISLVIGDASGNLSTWMEVQDNPQTPVRNLRAIHTLEKHDSAVASILPSARDKSLTTIDLAGTVHLDHMTSERHLLTLADRQLQLINVAPRNNAVIGLDRQGEVIAVKVEMPHPEVSFKTLFGKVWYESYDQPAYVWQSSSGSDDFEPKFSITPLLFGTIKGTLYAMIFAIPLAIFGAVYISQFSTGRFKKNIKPAIEIMASVPSVVIGFLIALWLAPLIEKGILSVFASLILLPLFFLLFMFLWQVACSRSEKLRHMRKGYEFLILAPILILSVLAATRIGPVVEARFFAGNFNLWLFNSLGTTYDQRNCIIIAFGLGFTVIPIIFSIAEDSLSNVPPNLTAASLALGASRWQTVWRVVLPSASPGIFAGIMIGFGRAVGETMIVLMATGNTPIMDWSIFNGMRTLSANIAVEIPEAPVDGTLYRVLFLCAVLLFVLTFLLNTGAEVIRDHLRKKYMRY